LDAILPVEEGTLVSSAYTIIKKEGMLIVWSDSAG